MTSASEPYALLLARTIVNEKPPAYFADAGSASWRRMTPTERILGQVLMRLHEATHLIHRPRRYTLPDAPIREVDCGVIKGLRIPGGPETAPLLTINRPRAEYDDLDPEERAKLLSRAGVPSLGTRLPDKSYPHVADEQGAVRHPPEVNRYIRPRQGRLPSLITDPP